MKVSLCNYNGKENCLVATRSMRQASILTGTHFRKYGHETFSKEDCKLALSTPGDVYESKVWKVAQC